MEKYKKYLIWIILAAAFLLRVINIFAMDMTSDDAHYAFRALGWFDFLGSNTQTTPVQWFGYVPWWGNLSFHDHPALAFLVQKIFFVFFGDNMIALRLPGVVAGLLVTYFLYIFLRKRKGENTALLGSFIYAVTSAALWMAYGQYLETVESVFILLSFMALTYFLEEESVKWLYLLALFIGLSLLTKYTALFLIPGALLVIFIKNKNLYKEMWPKFVVALCILIGVLLPAIIYNLETLATRGHFDAGLSSMVGMHPKDFELIAGRSTSFNLIQDSKNLFFSVWNINSPFIFVLFVFSLIYLVWKLVKRKEDNIDFSLLSMILFMVLMFLAAGGGVERYLTILSVFIAISVPVFIYECSALLRSKPQKIILGSIVGILLLGECVYAINTNILRVPFTTSEFFYSSLAFPYTGMDQFEDFVNQTFAPLPDMTHISLLSQVNNGFTGANAIFYDDRLDWFRYSWYVMKYQEYYKVPLLPISFLFNGKLGHTLPELLKDGPKEIYFVYITDNGPLDSVTKNSTAVSGPIEKFKTELDAQNTSVQNITDPKGEVTMKIYKVK